MSPAGGPGCCDYNAEVETRNAAHKIAKGWLSNANRPNGAAEWSHGWSDAAMCVAKPVGMGFPFLNCPDGGVEARVPGRTPTHRAHVDDPSAPPGQKRRNDARPNLSTGYGRRGDLHPWLHSSRPCRGLPDDPSETGPLGTDDTPPEAQTRRRKIPIITYLGSRLRPAPENLQTPA